MAPFQRAERRARWDDMLPNCHRAQDALRIAVVYQDTLLVDWAIEQCKRVEWLHGVLGAPSTWWKLRRLGNPDVLCSAIHAAQASEFIMVGVLAYADPSPVLERWIRGWLPCRSHHAGSLIALIGSPEPLSNRPSHVREYWRGIAAQGHMHYEAYDRMFPSQRPLVHVTETGDGSLGVLTRGPVRLGAPLAGSSSASAT